MDVYLNLTALKSSECIVVDAMVTGLQLQLLQPYLASARNIASQRRVLALQTMSTQHSCFNVDWWLPRFAAPPPPPPSPLPPPAHPPLPYPKPLSPTLYSCGSRCGSPLCANQRDSSSKACCILCFDIISRSSVLSCWCTLRMWFSW